MAIVLPLTGQPSDGEFEGGSPPGHVCLNYVGFENLLAQGSVTNVSSGDALNTLDYRPYTYWRPSGAGPHTFEVLMAAPVSMDYVAIHAYDLKGGTLYLDYFDGTVFQNAMQIDGLLVSGEPVMRLFAPQTSSVWRVRIENAVDPVLGVLFAGRWLGIPMQEVGWTPPRLSRETVLNTNVSDAGVFLGRSIVRQAWAFDITANFLRIDWAYETWLAFIRHAERSPFFFQWDVGYAGDTAFCWVEEEITPPEFVGQYHVDASMRVRAIVRAS